MSGLVGSGTLGENSYLSIKQRLSLLKSLSEVAKEYNVPLISGASAATNYELGKIIEGLAKVGVDTVMVMPPKTNVVPSEKEMYEYYALSEAIAKEVGITIMPYNNPDAAGYHALSTDLLMRLSMLSKVTALKISTIDEYVLNGEWAKANKISQALNSLSYLDAQPLLMEYLKLAMGIHHNDIVGGLRTFGKKLTKQQIDDVKARYILAKERLEVLDLIS